VSLFNVGSHAAYLDQPILLFDVAEIMDSSALTAALVR
jgi:hypothetical protein